MMIRLLLIAAGMATMAFSGPSAKGASVPLTVDGATVSTDVRTMDGKAYVPVADVARYLKMSISHAASGYALSTTGGAGQDNGAGQGEIGDVMFTGKWRFTVTGLTTADSYDEQYCQDRKKLAPNNATDTLVIVDCRLKNARTQTESPLLTERMPGNTAIADSGDQSYPLIDVDARQDLGKAASYGAAKMLPGSSVDFALVFSMPKNVTASALVFTIGTYPDDVGGKGTDVRVALK
jgi:hypothetical protein